jgi:hypothetical protein
LPAVQLATPFATRLAMEPAQFAAQRRDALTPRQRRPLPKCELPQRQAWRPQSLPGAPSARS